MFDLKVLLSDERGHLALLSEERINPALCKALKVMAEGTCRRRQICGCDPARVTLMV